MTALYTSAHSTLLSLLMMKTVIMHLEWKLTVEDSEMSGWRDKMSKNKESPKWQAEDFEILSLSDREQL